MAFATFLVWRLRTGACGVGACDFWRYCPPLITRLSLAVETLTTFSIDGVANSGNIGSIYVYRAPPSQTQIIWIGFNDGVVIAEQAKSSRHMRTRSLATPSAPFRRCACPGGGRRRPT